MSLEYDRIYELDSQASLTLNHNIAVDKLGDVEATKITLTQLYNILIPQLIAQLEANGQIITAGMIMPHASAILPDGWLWCDNTSYLRAGTYADLFARIGTTFGAVDGTHFNVPDSRGIALMGAGTSAKLTNANGVPFARVLGTYQNDKIQGRRYVPLAPAVNFTGYNAGTGVASGVNFGLDAPGTTGDAVTDGTNGTPRTGSETNPANLAVNFIIKY